MRIVVCVKYVPDMLSDRSLDGDGRLVRGLDDALNELDENSVEAAVALGEQRDDVEVIALTLGPADAVDAVRRALQMGADAAVHVTDERVAGADVLGTARILAAAVRTLEREAPVDLVVTSMATMDGLTSMLPTALAAVLERPALTLASRVDLDGDVLSITRSIGDAEEDQRVTLPALLSVTDQLNEPRFPGAAALMSARKKPLTTWSLDDLDGGAELAASGVLATTEVRAAEPRPPRETGRLITDTGDAGARLAAYLVENKLA